MSAPPPYNPQNVGGNPPQQGYPPQGGYPPAVGYGQQPGFGGPPPGYPAQPPRRGNRGLLIGGAIAAALALCCIVVAVAGIIILARGASGSTSGARNAAEGYYDAVRDHDWTTAHSHLSRSLGTTVSTSALQTLWTAQELSTGRVTSFSVTNSKVSTNNGRTTAVVTGTVRYTKGSSETKTINLVKEGDDWKLASLPVSPPGGQP